MDYLPAIIFALCTFLVLAKSLCVLNHMNRKTPMLLRGLYIMTSTLGFCGLLVQAQPHWWLTSTLGFCGLLVQAQPHWWLALIALVVTILFIEWDPLHGHESWEKLKRYP